MRVRAEVLHARELQIMWSQTETEKTTSAATNQGKTLWIKIQPINAPR